MQTDLSKAEKLILKLKPKYLVTAFFAIVVLFFVLWGASRIKVVTVTVDGEATTVTTALADPYKVLDNLGIELSPDDKISYTNIGKEGIFGELGQNKATITIKSAVNVEVHADNLKYHVTVGQGDTVEEVLELSGLTVREDDILSVDPKKVVTEGDKYSITRVDYIITTEEETIPHGKYYRGTSLLSDGKTAFIAYGKNGTLVRTYQQRMVDGVLEEKLLLSEEITKKPVDSEYVIGDGSVISPLDYGFNIVNGVPTEFIKKYERVRATGYYAPYGAGTATGRLAQVGYVAVDPNIIPYGTKLWIVAHGNTGFVYGYALAADTGGAMLSGKNFVDLYYSSYYECVLNGLRYVDVYVLEYPTKD